MKKIIIALVGLAAVFHAEARVTFGNNVVISNSSNSLILCYAGTVDGFDLSYPAFEVHNGGNQDLAFSFQNGHNSATVNYICQSDKSTFNFQISGFVRGDGSTFISTGRVFDLTSDGTVSGTNANSDKGVHYCVSNNEAINQVSLTFYNNGSTPQSGCHSTLPGIYVGNQ